MEELNSIFSIVVDIVVCYIIFRCVFFLVFRPSQSKLDELEIRKKIWDITHVVKEEKYNGVTYWFDSENDQFLAQGYSAEEIFAHLKQRFPKHLFIVDKSFFLGPEFKQRHIDELDEIDIRSNIS